MVYILILNWNGWRDTIECLESVFRNDYPSYRVIVCDNNSGDGSLEHIKKWADGHLNVDLPVDNPLRGLSFPPVPKPVRYVEYDRAAAEAGGDRADAGARLVLIQTGANLGFAGGNNVGLRYALARDDFDYVWLLNNDTVIKADALTSLVRRMREKPDAGMCGSTLLYYHQPDKVQALGGGTYNKWLGVSRHIGVFQNVSALKDPTLVETKMDYVVGASMFVSKAFIDRIGLLCEDYFLYFEELDWAVRAKGQYYLAYAPKSIVYHKEGGSIGSNSNPNKKSLLADIYGIRNRIIFSRKFYPYALPTVYFGLLIAIFNRVRRKQINRLPLLFKAIWKNKEEKFNEFK